MYIYLICFGISCFFIKLSESNSKRKFLHNLYVIIGLLIPCLLAGFRADTIGTDVQVYLKPLFECANYSDNLLNFFTLKVTRTKLVSDFETGFALLVFFITKIFGNIQFVYFFIELFIIVFVYKGLRKINSVEHNKIWLGMLIFYLMSYNKSLNIMRQYISIAIIFYGLSCLIQNSKMGTIKFFISIAIAFLFHRSALLGILLYVFYKIININKDNLKIRIGKYRFSIKFFLIILISTLGIFLINNTKILVTLLGNINLDYYSRYIDGNVALLTSSIIKVLPIALMYIVSRKHFKKEYPNAYFYILVFIYSIVIEQFTSVNPYAARIALLFSMVDIVSFAELSCSFNDRKIKAIAIIALICYLLFYWYYYFVFGGGSETIPYKAFWM